MTYTALTIGPIIASLNKAHKTREIWAASYLFSHLMEMIINNLLTDGVKENQFILPYPKARDFDIKNEFKRAGIFPDRLVLKSEDGLFDKLDKASEDAIKEIVNYFNAANKKDTSDYFNKYLRTNIIEIEETELSDEANVIVEINKLLANTELQSRLIAEDPMYFETFLEKIYDAGLFTDIFGKGHSYPSIIEIATRGLKLPKNYFSNLDDEKELWEKLRKDKNYNDKLKTAHKYIAIIQADGDNVGKLIKQIYDTNPALITEFSKTLSQFSFEAVKVITEYGGEPIYAGGDDLLFFAPVITKDKNVFYLLRNLDCLFNKFILSNKNLKNTLNQLTETTDECGNPLKLPSMSYGL